MPFIISAAISLAQCFEAIMDVTYTFLLPIVEMLESVCGDVS